MYKYEVIIYWSDEDQVFIAELPELPGCMAHGESQESALKNAQEAGQQADIQKGISQGIFTTDVSANPKAEKETADMLAQTAHARLANEERQAFSTQLLDRFLHEQKQLLDDQYGNLLAG